MSLTNNKIKKEIDKTVERITDMLFVLDITQERARSTESEEAVRCLQEAKINLLDYKTLFE